MGSLLGDWPSYDPHNFSQLRPADPSGQPSKLTPVAYHPTHNRTLPPKNQGVQLTQAIISESDAPLPVISTEAKNILLRHFYQKSEKLRLKRAASDNLKSEHNCKQPRGAYGNDSQ